MVTAQQYADAAAALVGSRFHHHGRRPGCLDCAGIVFVAAWQTGLDTPDHTDYGPTPQGDVVRQAIVERCTPRPWAEWMDPGRVIVMRHRIDGEPRHFAVSLGGGMAIHQESRARFLDLRENVASIHSVMMLQGVEP
jgi:cell wall-associated NlpC family hydrolase